MQMKVFPVFCKLVLKISNSSGQAQVVQSSDAVSSNFQGEAYGEQIREFGEHTNSLINQK